MDIKVNKNNLIWYFILLICVLGLFFFYKYQVERYTNLKKNGIKTIGYCIVKQPNLLERKQNQKVSWVYNIDEKKYRAKIVKSAPIKLQNYEHYTIYYKVDDKEEFFIDYTDFILNGKYLNTESIHVDKVFYNKNEIFFKYVVDNIEYERYQRLKFELTNDFSKKYLVKYNVRNPKIGYIYLDSIR